MGDLDQRFFLVTGASSGIGLATVDGLLARGAAVTIATRSEERTKPVLEALAATHEGAQLFWLRLDLADLRQVQRAAEGYLATGRRLDVLVNNAGVAGGRGLTADGFDVTVGTDHLGPYLFTKLLLPKLRESSQGRVVNVASQAHYSTKAIDWAALRTPARGARESLVRYSIAKLMNVLHAKELARRLADTAVTTYALHPGVVASDVWREVPWPIRPVIKLFMISNEEGAKTSLYCATAPELAKVSGRYYEKCQEKRASRLSDDPELAKKLFEWSEESIAAALAARAA
ncbi:MAG TPA: SDR family oxidoreductase [Myxococcales bacterium]|nr:SDR family oxidoreductase [Myxococcales bacterium]